MKESAIMEPNSRGKTMHSSTAVANEILKLAQAKKDTVTPLQLMKLVFLCHGWMLGLYSRHLISDPIEAWQYGPVIKKLYEKIRHFRSSPVNYPLKDTEQNSFDNEESDIIKQVYEQYGQYSGLQLSALTHQEGSPWYVTWENNGRNARISNDLIEDYYKRLAAQSAA